MGLGEIIGRWPVVAQLTTRDRLGRGAAAMSQRTRSLLARTEAADRVVGSVCPNGSASLQLTTGPARCHEVLYRPPCAR